MANILIADDSPIQILILERILLKKGHTVFKSGNGHDALEILKTKAIDILITDIFMPEIDGVELIMKTNDLNENVGIIAISGGGQMIQDVKYLDYVKQLGADFSFIKPVEEKDLLEAIQSIATK